MGDADIIKSCWNCGNNGGDKTDHTEKNPCTNCDVKRSFGYVNLVPDSGQINWIEQSR